MKHTLFILALITATIQTFAQSPRIKLNQITKDSVTGSVLISSPTDSGMVYSRDLFISYGADTVLILGADTLAATSSIISSVLSDGVTITGDGTTGNELTVDTNTVIATKQDLDLYYLDSNPDGYTSNTGTVTSVGGTGTVNGISLSGTVTSSGNLTLGGTLSGVDLASQVTGTLPVANGGTGSATLNFVDLSSAQTVGGAKTFSTAIVVNEDGNNVNTRFEGDTDANLLFLDASTNRVGIGTNSPSQILHTVSTTDGFGPFFTNSSGRASININSLNNSSPAYVNFNNSEMFLDANASTKVFRIATSTTNGYIAFETNQQIERMRITSGGEVYIAGTTDQGAYNLQVNGTGVWGAGAYVNGSDITLKENIQSLNKGLDYIKKLNPVQYNYKSTFSSDQSKQLGFIAQDVMVALEDLSDAIVKDNGNYLSMAYQNLIPITVKAIQEQQTIIESIQTELDVKSSIIESQATEIELLKTLITELSNRLTTLENN